MTQCSNIFVDKKYTIFDIVFQKSKLDIYKLQLINVLNGQLIMESLNKSILKIIVIGIEEMNYLFFNY
jgi:hypothetical protein